jgi:hypothetical protein
MLSSGPISALSLTRLQPPSAEAVIDYLSKLKGEERLLAETYVRCAPPQIDTAYRRRIVQALGWTFRDSGG